MKVMASINHGLFEPTDSFREDFLKLPLTQMRGKEIQHPNGFYKIERAFRYSGKLYIGLINPEPLSPVAK